MTARTAIVTGAAGGVGAATVEMYRARQVAVVAVDRNPAVTDLFHHDDGVVTVIGDVAEPATSAESIDVALRRFGRIDVLVNNAAKFLYKPFSDTSVEELDELMRINVRSTFLFCQAVLPSMVSQRDGSIINVSSISGLTGAPDQVVYGATKGAIIALTRALAIEVAGHNVRVNTIAPGAIDTNFVRDATGTALEAHKEQIAAIAAMHPLGRIASPAEIASAIGYLTSPEASFITGAVVPVDGGWTAQ